MADRTFFVRLNLDDLSAETEALDSTEERGQWLEGFKVGCRGHAARDAWAEPKRMGHAFGMTCWTQAEAFREAQSVKGQRSAEARKASSGTARPKRADSTESEPRLNRCSNHGSQSVRTEREPIHKPEAISQELQATSNPQTPQGGRRARMTFSPGMWDHMIPVEFARVGVFVDAWHRWVQDRKARSKPMTEEAARLQLAKLHREAKTPDVAIEWIDGSIAAGWQGIFPPRNNQQTARPFGRPGPASLRASVDQALIDQLEEQKNGTAQDDLGFIPRDTTAEFGW